MAEILSFISKPSDKHIREFDRLFWDGAIWGLPTPVLEWLDENAIAFSHTVRQEAKAYPQFEIEFENAAGAVAFKLRWM